MNVEDAVLSSTSQHRCTMSPCSITRPATAQWPAGQCINLHKKERRVLYSSTFQIENYLKTSGYKRW